MSLPVGARLGWRSTKYQGHWRWGGPVSLSHQAAPILSPSDRPAVNRVMCSVPSNVNVRWQAVLLFWLSATPPYSSLKSVFFCSTSSLLHTLSSTAFLLTLNSFIVIKQIQNS